MASKSDDISTGKKVGLAIATLSGVATGASALDFYMQSQGVKYHVEGEVAHPVDSPDYPVLFNNGAPYVDINGNGTRESFDYSLPAPATTEWAKTRAHWLANEALGIREVDHFTYFSAYHSQRNLFSVGTDGSLNMGPHRFILNKDETSIFYDEDNDRKITAADREMGSIFNSNVIPQLIDIMKSGRNVGESERKLAEAQAGIGAHSAEEIAVLQAELAEARRQIAQAGGNGIELRANGYDGVSQDEYNSKLEAWKVEKSNYDLTVQILQSQISKLQGTLLGSATKVSELEGMVKATASDYQNAQRTLVQAQQKLQSYLTSSENPEVSEYGPIPTDESLEISRVEKTVEDLYLAGVDADIPQVPETKEPSVDETERAYHGKVAANAQSRFVPSTPEELEARRMEEAAAREQARLESVEADKTERGYHTGAIARANAEHARLDVAAALAGVVRQRQPGLDESELIFMLGGGASYRSYPGSLASRWLFYGEAGIGLAGKAGAVGLSARVGGRPAVHLNGEEPLEPNRLKRWTEDYTAILLGDALLEYHTPHLGPLALVAKAGFGADLYNRGKVEALWKPNRETGELEPSREVITSPALDATPHLIFQGGLKLRLSDVLELNANGGYSFDLIRGEDNKMRLVGKGLNVDGRLILSPPSRYNRNR